MEGLKVCPFCGKRAEVYKTEGVPGRYYIGCTREKCVIQNRTYTRKVQAMIAWNRRKGEEDER